MKKYTFIVPVFCAEKYLEMCISSLTRQTYGNIEIILVDDGSPDNCPLICDNAARNDGRIVVIHKENGGVVSARLIAAQRATGDYICCVDADDYVEECLIETVNKVIEEFEPEIVCYGFNTTDDVSNNTKTARTYENIPAGIYDKTGLRKLIYPQLISRGDGRYFNASLWTKVIKKELFLSAQAKVPTTVKIGEDAACSFQCLVNCSRMYILHDRLYYYRLNRESATKSRRPFSWDSSVSFSEFLQTEFCGLDYDFKPQVFRLIEHHFFNVAVSQFLKKEKYSVIKDEILEKMELPCFRKAINEARFSDSLKARIMDCCIKRKAVSAIYMYSIIEPIKRCHFGMFF